MKKLLLFLCAALIGASAAQAASVKWQISGGTKGDTVYIYNTDLTSTIATWTDGSTYSTDNTSDITSALAGYATSATYGNRNAAGTLTADSIASTITAIVYSDVADGSSFKYVTFSTEGFTFDGNESAPGTATGTLKSATFSFKTPSQPDDPGGDDIVPEPTTVALLALGLAAFGLKRKIA